MKDLRQITVIGLGLLGGSTTLVVSGAETVGYTHRPSTRRKARRLRVATEIIDTSRMASGPANIWAEVLLTNAGDTIKGVDRIIAELTKLRRAIKVQDSKRVAKLLAAVRDKWAALTKYKMGKKERVP